jgi:hypothetical protein
MALELKDVYENLQSQNIEVFAVLSGSDVESWADFVNEYELKWINVYDPYKSSNYETYYGTFKTPRIYLLDNANEILAKDIKPASILAFIKDYENKKFNSNSPFEFFFGR